MKRITKFILTAILLISISFVVVAAKPFKKYKASYYADKFNGRKTATGHIFHNNKISIATSEPKYFNKYITLRSLENGKIYKVFCNDKMNPRMKGSVHFDLSKKLMEIFSRGKHDKIPGHIYVEILGIS